MDNVVLLLQGMSSDKCLCNKVPSHSLRKLRSSISKRPRLRLAVLYQVIYDEIGSSEILVV